MRGLGIAQMGGERGWVPASARTREEEGSMGEARRDGGWERAVREPPLREKKEVARWRDSSTPLRYARNDMFPDRIGRDGNGMLL